MRDRKEILKHWKAWMDTVPTCAHVWSGKMSPELIQALFHAGMGRERLLRDALGVVETRHQCRIHGDTATAVIADDIR